MDDLFKNIKDNLENRPEPVFEEQAWRKMEKRLNQKPLTEAKSFVWFWVLPLALGMLLLSNIFFYKNLNEANEKISKLELRSDTVVLTRYIYQYDTIYQTRVEKEYVVFPAHPQTDFYAAHSLFVNRSSGIGQSSNWIAPSAYAPLTFAELKYLFEEEQGDEVSQLAENASSAENPVNQPTNHSKSLRASPYLKSAFSPLAYDTEPLEFSYLDPPAVNYRKRKRPFQKLAGSLQPDAYQLGVGGGLAYPQYKNVTEPGGFSAGVNGAITFFDNFRLAAEVDYYKVNFRYREIGNSLGIPEMEPPSDQYVFAEAIVKQPFFQYSLGLQYIFNVKKKWNPYLGFNYSFASMLLYEVYYDFEHIAGDTELTIEQKIPRNDLIMNMFLVNGGVEAKLSNRIGLQLEGYYRWNGNNEGLLVTNIWGLRSNLIYKF